MRGQLPLAMAHVIHFLGIHEESLVHQMLSYQDEPVPLRGAQLILHSRGSTRCIVQGLLKPGVYSLEHEAITYRREGISLLDCQSEEEFVVTCAIPLPGTQVDPEAPLLKIQTLDSILEVDNSTMRPWASRVCTWAYEGLKLL